MIERVDRRVFSRPLDLLCPARFDICAKHVYARWRGDGMRSEWGGIVYDQHILATNFGREKSADGAIEKEGVREFRNAYHRILDDIGRNGFVAEKGAVPLARNGILMNGAHRAAACIYYQKPITAEFYDEPTHRYDYNLYDSRGLDSDVLDFMAMEYALLADDCRMFLVWASAERFIAEIRRMSTAAAEIVCEKKIAIKHWQMARNIVEQVYSGEPWIDNPRSAASKTHNCFTGGGAIYAMLVCASPESLSELKERVRALVGIKTDSAHSTDDKNETVRLARLFFNRNSVHYLQHARSSFSSALRERMAAYASAIKNDGRNAENFCVHGSAVMDVYGIRKSRDLDYVSADGVALETRAPGIDIGNDKPALAGMSIADAVEDPRNYFYCNGIKFASLRAVAAMKQNRGEDKDRRDIDMIQSLLSRGKWDAISALWRRRWLLRQQLRYFRQSVKARLGFGKRRRRKRK